MLPSSNPSLSRHTTTGGTLYFSTYRTPTFIPPIWMVSLTKSGVGTRKFFTLSLIRTISVLSNVSSGRPATWQPALFMPKKMKPPLLFARAAIALTSGFIFLGSNSALHSCSVVSPSLKYQLPSALCSKRCAARSAIVGVAAPWFATPTAAA